VTRTIALEDPDGRTIDTETVPLPSDRTSEETESLVWQAGADVVGTAAISARSEDTRGCEELTAEEPGSSTGPSLSPVSGTGDVDDGDVNLDTGNADGSRDTSTGPGSDISIDADTATIG